MPKRNVSVIQSPIPLDHLPKKQIRFLELYARLGDAKEAYLQAGYRDSIRTKANARKLLLELSEYVEPMVAAYIQSTDITIMAFSQIKNLAANADSEAIRLQAAKEILSRQGWDQPKEVTVNHNYRNMSDEDIDRKIKDIQAELVRTIPHEQATET